MSFLPSSRRARSGCFDVGVAGAVVGLTALGPTGLHPPVPAWIGCAMAAALLARRRWPLAVLAMVSALALAQVLLVPDGSAVLFDVAVLIAMYSVVKYSKRLRDCFLAAVPVVAGIAIEVWRGATPPYRLTALFWYISLCGGVWAIGYTMRNRRQYVQGLEDRAATAEREREHLARIAVADERAVIARELHDIVAHSMAVMVVQAHGAAYALEQDTAAAKAAINQVAETGREALADMRQLVHVLRDGGETNGAVAGESDPDRRRITLDRLDALVDQSRSAGLRVTLRTDPPAGPRSALPPAVELAAYRIIQESLTNTLRHAGSGTAVTVDIRYGDEALTLDVVDDGGQLAPGRVDSGDHPGGHGLIGMRERVVAHGGQFSAGPHGTGWQVHATIPYPVPLGSRLTGPATGEQEPTILAVQR